MSMLTAPSIGVDLTLDGDEQFSEACEADQRHNAPGEVRPVALWRVTMSCSCTVLFCDRCKQEAVELDAKILYRRVLGYDFAIVCDTHNVRGVRVTRIEPLKRG